MIDVEHLIAVAYDFQYRRYPFDVNDHSKETEFYFKYNLFQYTAVVAVGLTGCNNQRFLTNSSCIKRKNLKKKLILN